MRIGIDARPLTAPTTGIGRYTSEILRRIAGSGHELFLYSHAPLSSAPLARNVTLRCGNIRSAGLGSVFAQARFPLWIRQDALDVFWSPRHHLPLLTRVPTVVTIHDLVWRKVPESMVPLGRTLEQALMPASLRKARSIIAVSKATRRDIREFMPAAAEKCRVIHEAPFTPATDTARRPVDSEPYILFVGTFEPRKNLPGLLEAFRQLLAAGNRTHRLILAGGPGWGADVKTLIVRAGLEGRVQTRHPCSQAELEDLYRNCEFLALPSFYEGFCLPIAEAMAFGKPVVTSNTSSMPEVAGSGGLLVDPGRPASIASAMARLISDPGLSEELSHRARAQAGRFSWDGAARETLTVLEAAAATRAPKQLPPAARTGTMSLRSYR